MRLDETHGSMDWRSTSEQFPPGKLRPSKKGFKGHHRIILVLVILLMVQNSGEPVEVGSFAVYLHPRWCKKIIPSTVGGLGIV